MKRIASAALATGLLAGCVTSSTLEGVQAGMNPDQVQAILGEPEAVAHAPGTQCSYYTALKDFRSRAPWSVSNRNNVCYDDGRVKSCGRADASSPG